MRGIQGVIVAIGLGIAAGLLNWLYLASLSSQETTVSFVGIAQGQTVNRGETLREETPGGTENSRALDGESKGVRRTV